MEKLDRQLENELDYYSSDGDESEDDLDLDDPRAAGDDTMVDSGGLLADSGELVGRVQLEIEKYRVQGRGGQGVINMVVDERNGRVVGSVQVHDGDQLMMMTNTEMIMMMITVMYKTVSLKIGILLILMILIGILELHLLEMKRCL